MSDRLSRNMLEGGEIIDMIDMEIIKDLKFVTHHFTSDSGRKMLLGMAFVLSKQYSDKLSTDVKRGVRRRFANEGKTSIPKHGYINKEGVYKPDSKNFDLICDAWNMRSEGESIEKIAKYMNDNGYLKQTKTGKNIDMDMRILSQTFRDPFYYGLLIQAKQTVDLRELYGFKPATTEEIYNKVQELSRTRLKPFNTRKRLTFYPLKALIRCEFCNRNMYVAPSKGNTKRLLYYRCDNSECKRKKRSIRAKVIFNYIYGYLEKGLNLTEADYHAYYDNLKKITDEKRQTIKIELHSKQAVYKNIKREITERSLAVVKPGLSEVVVKENEKKIAGLEVDKKELWKEIQKTKTHLKTPEEDRLSLEQFLNLSKNAKNIVKLADAITKDKICRFIFLNLWVDEEKVTRIRLKEPFNTLLKGGEPPTSRPLRKS